MKALDTTLVGFGTRNTLSNATSTTRGIGAARQWIFDELKRSSAKLQVSFDTYQIAQQGRITRPVELRNVMAVLPGRSPRRIYVSGHYDSLNIGPGGQIASNSRAPAPGGGVAGGLANSPNDPQQRPGIDYDVDAPGANDDGSGTVLTMELARVFAESGLEFDATLVFICWAGEEQGLIGSAAHAQRIAAEKVIVEAMISNDIVGNSRGGTGVVDAASVRVYAVGPEDSPARALARYIVAAGATYVPSHRVRPMAREDRFGRGSDQSSFTQQGYPAVVFREANENFDRQHSARDTLDGVDFAYLAQNARVNAAAVASLALAPPAPVVVERARRGAHRPRSVRLRRRAALDGVAGRDRLSRLLARDVAPRLAAHAHGRQRHRGRAARRVDRRLGVRRRGDRRRRAREPGQRLRLAGAARAGRSSW